MFTLTKAEERIMQILWDIDKGFIKDIIEHFPKPKPPYNTVSTIVRVLVKKDIVGFKTYGGSYQYFPLISKEEYRKGQMKKLVKEYYNNSLKQVVSYFSEKPDLDVEEVDEVLKMLNEIKKNKYSQK
jgi:predicted transcriptional regulator